MLQEKGATYIFNHVKFILSYHKGTGSGKDGRIVRAKVEVMSCESPPCKKSSKGLTLKTNGDLSVSYYYSIEFTVSANLFCRRIWMCVCMCIGVYMYGWVLVWVWVCICVGVC